MTIYSKTAYEICDMIRTSDAIGQPLIDAVEAKLKLAFEAGEPDRTLVGVTPQFVEDAKRCADAVLLVNGNRAFFSSEPEIVAAANSILAAAKEMK